MTPPQNQDNNRWIEAVVGGGPLGNARIVFALAFVVGLGVFLVDAFAPLNIAVAVLYVVVVLLVSSVASTNVTITVAWLCVALTMLGFLISQNDPVAPSSIARCGVSLSALIAVSILAVRNQGVQAMLRHHVDLLNLTHDAVVVYGLDGRITFWSHGAERLYGWSAAEAIGRPLHELTDAPGTVAYDEIHKQMTESGYWHGELQRIRKGGAIVRVASRVMLSRDRWGHPVGILSTDDDITETRRMEAELREQKEDLRATLDAIPAMVWSSLDDGRPTYVNQRWSEYGIDTSCGSDMWPHILHPDDLAQVQAGWEAAVDKGSNFERTARIRHRDGTYRWTVIASAPLRGVDGRTKAWYGVNTDIDALRKAEQALDRSRNELAHTTRVSMLGELAASIAHEVTQPLAAIVTTGEAGLRWLNREPPELGEVRASIEQSTSDARRATEVIRRIRSMAKKRDAEITPIDVNGIIEESVELVRREVSSHGVEMSVSLERGPLVVYGDRVQLQQVVINLLMNGVQAMANISDGPKLTIITARSEGTARVRIDDSGHGISEANQQLLFSPFFTTRKDGMGMGLSICRSIVEAHGGRIWAENRQNRGARMQFTLPLAQNATQHGTQNPVLATTGETNNE
ncbi:PAS domain-containing sensor histidine kinase [Paraburkholderia bannensis]|uniref:PAS domain-containing sensor histidine kinase n=1 Tax=Paraburkholderia bannensis TaxID=765414 RepID=UPI002AB711CA|nr:PAS domain S-box protein [Paraburkholderia bannensis]